MATETRKITEESSDFYNEYYRFRRPSPFADGLIKFWHKRMFDIAAKIIPDFKDKSLLEMGVGMGYFGEVCVESGMAAYAAVEMNSQLTILAQQKGLTVTNACIPPFPEMDKKVDVIWMSHVIEHATDYLHARAMASAAFGKLNSGGRLVIISPDYLDWGKQFFNADWSHGFPTTLRRLTQLLNDVGFRVVFGKHHVGTFTNDFVVLFLALLFLPIPVRMIDYVLVRLTGRPYCYSLMTLLGWRQIYIVAQKAETHTPA